MIDLRTDDGISEALRAIAAWPPPEPDIRPISIAPVPPAAPAGRERRARWSVAAAILAIGLLAGALVLAGRDRTVVADGAWRTMAPSPLSPRFAPISLWIGDRLLVWGGHDAEGTELADGATYDPATDRWSEIADQPFPYERRAGSSIGATEGWWSTSPTPGTWFRGKAWFVLTSPDDPWGWDLVTYDPAADRWEQVDRARFEQQPSDALVMTEGTATVQQLASLVVHDGRLVAFGWHSQRYAYGWATFDPTTGAWGPFTGVPDSGPDYGLNWATTGPVLMADRYLVWVPSQPLGSAPRSGFSIDLDTGEVVDLDAPTDRNLQWVSGFAADGVAIGGWTPGNLGDGRRYASRLDPATGRWTPVDALSSGPAEAADDEGAPAVVATSDGTVVVAGLDRPYEVGGIRSTPGDQVLVDGRWRRLPEAPIDLARADPIAVWTGSELLVWGGAALAEDGAPTATVPLADGARFLPS